MKEFIKSIDKAILACNNMENACDKICVILKQTTKILKGKP